MHGRRGIGQVSAAFTDILQGFFIILKVEIADGDIEIQGTDPSFVPGLFGMGQGLEKVFQPGSIVQL